MHTQVKRLVCVGRSVENAGGPLSYILELHSHLAQLVGENKGTTDYIGKRGGLFGSTV